MPCAATAARVKPAAKPRPQGLGFTRKAAERQNGRLGKAGGGVVGVCGLPALAVCAGGAVRLKPHGGAAVHSGGRSSPPKPTSGGTGGEAERGGTSEGAGWQTNKRRTAPEPD